MNNIIKIINLPEDSSVLIDGRTETIKHEKKAQEYGFLKALLAPLVASLVQLLTASVVNCITERGVRSPGRGYMNKNL